MKFVTSKKRDQIILMLFLFILCFNFTSCSGEDCDTDKPIFRKSKNKCVLEYCTEDEFLNGECSINNPIIKKQWLGEFLYATESGNPIYSSFGRNSEGDIYFESSLGNPYSQKKIFTLKSDGREYIDGLRRNVINLDSNLYSTYGIGAIVEIDSHKCYLKLSNYEAVEMYDFDDKKYTSAKLEDILGYKVESHKNSLLITSTKNTFIYAYITTGNYLMMQKFKVVSNDASNCIQLIKTLKENVKTISKDSRRCMITKKQYIECLDMDENQMYVIRIYDINLNFLKQYELEKNNAPSDRAFKTYHEIVWLKDEISISIYYTDTSENNSKPIMILKKLTISNSKISLDNLNTYLIKDTVYRTMNYKFSDTENSLAIFNEYYFGLASITETTNRHLIVALFNIFNDDLTIDTHYFDVPLKDLYDIEYQSGLQAFGYKNAYGVQMNYKYNNEYRSGFIVFGYGNTTDPEPINNLFDKYSSYKIKVKDFYKGIENNIFCYVFVSISVTEIPNINYITVKNAAGRQIRKGDSLTLNDELTITRRNSNSIPKGRYVLGLTPYLNEADYNGFIGCSSGADMFGKQVPTDWYPDEYYGRTIEFKFTVGIDCYENCETCTNKGLSIDDQQCDTCKSGYYFVENTKNCFGEPPEGYYFNRNKKVYSKCYDTCKICSTINEGVFHNCLSCKENYLFYRHTNCLDCKYRNKYVNYEQTECIDSVPDGFYVNNSEYNTIDKCYKNCLTCSKGLSDDGNMNCLSCDNANGYYLVENTNNCEKDPYPGYYLEDNIWKKCHISCATCSAKPILNSNGEVTNCDTCNKDLGFYPVENSNTCVNKTREGEYFDENCKCYKKCYKDCLTCSGKEVNEYHMNCLSCDKSKKFTYFEKTTNCLNCKSLSKYVNYEQTECIDSVPTGYYVNDTEINTIDKCYTDCKTCSAGGTVNSMNCLTCQPSLYLKNGNCVKTYTCPYKFFYQVKIDKNADLNQKICLDQNEICPCALPFYYTHTNECVESCPLELLLYQGCKISNLPYGLNKLISLVKLYYSLGNLDTLSKSFSLSDYTYLYNLAVKLSVYSLFSSYSYSFFRNLEMANDYQSLSNDNITSVNESDYFGGSDVDLGNCEKKLREYYNISDNIRLTIIKLDFKKNDSSVNNIQYEIFNPENRTERLDLSICNDEKIIVKNPLDSSITPNRITLIEDYGLYSEKNDFFNNECSIFTSEEGTDVLIQDRMNGYNYNNKICQNDCEFKEINKTTGEALCLCPPNKGFINASISNIEEIMSYSDQLTSTNNSNNDITYQKYSSVNAKVLKCSKNIPINFFKNYILIIYTLLLIGYITISAIFLIFKKKLWKKYLEEYEKNQNQISEKPNRSKSDNNPKPKSDDELGSNNPSSKETIKSSINHSTQNITDKDMLDYSEAINKDNRKILSILFSSLKKRVIIIFSFVNDQNIDVLKKLLLILAFINYFATNTFFFTEKNIHQIYLDKGKYNFAYQCKNIIFASLISSVFLYLAKFMCTINKKYNEKNVNKLSLKVIILISVSTCIFIFYWVYIGSFTSTYINAKKHLIINTAITFLFCCILDCLLAIISATFRIFGLKKKKSRLYSISRSINFL